MKKAIVAILCVAVSFLAPSCKKLDVDTQASESPRILVPLPLSENDRKCPVLEDKEKTRMAKAGLVLGGSPVLYIDFDGENNVAGEPWGLSGTFNCPNPGFTSAQKDTIFKMVIEDFKPFNVLVVKTLAEFQQAGGGLKMRCIITNKNARIMESSLMAYNVGLAYIGSLVWGDNTPALVFANEFLGSDRYKKIAESVSHELGHTFGCYHHSQPGSTPGIFIGDYHWPSSNLEDGTLMGNSYQVKFSSWRIGPSSSLPYGELQDHAAVIAGIAGYKPESFGSVMNTSTQTLSNTLINAVLVDSENKHAFYKATTGTKTLRVISNGNLNIKVAVYSSPTATPTIYDDLSSGNVVVSITGKKWIQVFTEQPAGYLPSPVGGGYTVKVQ